MSHAGRTGRGDAVVMSSRWYWVISGLVIMVIAVVLGMAWVVVSRRHRSVLDRVDREIAAGRYGAAPALDGSDHTLDGAGRIRLSAGLV